MDPAKRGRDDRIRTCDPLTPSQVRYQAAPHPETWLVNLRKLLVERSLAWREYEDQFRAVLTFFQ